MPPLLVPPARPPVRAAVVVVLAPFRCRAPAPAPPARGEDVVRGEPAPTLVALAAGPEYNLTNEKRRYCTVPTTYVCIQEVAHR